MSADRLREMVAAHTEDRQFGVLGEPRVNVLQLNLSLDRAAPSGSEGRDGRKTRGARFSRPVPGFLRQCNGLLLLLTCYIWI